MILHKVLPRSFAKQSQIAAVRKPTGGIMMKRISAFSFALLASALLATSESSGANLLINGSFEDTGATYVNGGAGYMALYGSEWTTIPGWTAKDIDWMGANTYWVASEGISSIDMNGTSAGYIKQDFATVVGQTYTVSFDLADNNYCGGPTKTLRVSAAGSQQDYTHATGWASWAAETFAFTATAASTTLGFYSLETGGNCGAIIDNVRAEADQPPPPVNQAPDVSTATPSIASIWPPNNKMVPITINGVTDPDGDAVTITITAITNNETLAADAAFSGSTAQVKATRNGKGTGRTYTISFTATDGKGGTSSGSVTVVVPHDQGGAVADDDQDDDHGKVEKKEDETKKDGSKVEKKDDDQGKKEEAKVEKKDDDKNKKTIAKAPAKRAKPTAVETATWGEVKNAEQK